MKQYKIRKNGKYAYLYLNGGRVAGINGKGKMWGWTEHFKEFKKLLKKTR